MITITVSFKPDGSSAEVIAQVTRLLAGPETQTSAVAPGASCRKDSIGQAEVPLADPDRRPPRRPSQHRM
jgi:hypothetical protein